MGLGGGTAPVATPAPPPPPPPLPSVPNIASKAIQGAGINARLAASAAAGPMSTILTGPLGRIETPQPQKTLLGS